MRRLFGVFLLASFLSFPVMAATPAYLLAPEEIARYRALEGKPSHQALGGKDDPLMRAIRTIAGGRVGSHHDDGNWSVLQVFNDYISGPPHDIVVEGGRLLFGSACRGPECEEGASFIIDLQTGQVAIAFVIQVYIDGGPMNGGHLNEFLMACADPEFRRLAHARLRAWGEKMLWPGLRKERRHVRMTSCAPPPPTVAAQRPPRVPGSPRLTRDEIAAAKAIAGPTRKLFDAAPTRRALRRVFAQLAGEGSSRVSGEELPLFHMLLETFRRSTMSINPDDDRFYIGFGCHDGERACSNRSWLLIDTRTGDVAVVLMHDFDEAGKRLEIRGLVVFTTRCASRALRDYAMETARQDGELIALGRGWPRSEAPQPRVIEAHCSRVRS